MGNIGSQTGHTNQSHQINEEQQWAHSFPRTQQRFNHPKVLPERDPRQKLRHTDNGEILQSGGTLSGRYHDRLSLERNEEKTRNPPTKSYLSNQRDPLHKSGNRYYQNNYNHNYGDKIKRFGSEPNLHLPYNQNDIEDQDSKSKMKAKKKYRAPLPPNSQVMEWEENSSSENGPVRKTRMFKTRTETKKYYSSPSPVYNRKSLEYKKKFDHENIKNDKTEIIQIREQERNKNLNIHNRLSLPEIKLIKNNINFHEELKEATKRLKQTKIDDNDNNNKPKDEKHKLKTLDHNISKKDNIRLKMKQIVDAEEKKKNISSLDFIRGECSGKESSSPEHSALRITRDFKSKETPKTFYFGMEESSQNDDIIDHFASNLHPNNCIVKIENSSESDISSELEIDENQALRNGIDLQLRPILPKKQLEIPRFSPAAAWRLLSTVDSNLVASTIASDDAPVFIEDRIEKYSRPPPPTIQLGPRSNNDKSGDSGISGDAGPPPFDDTPDTILNSKNNLQLSPQLNRTHGISWTPQQDLGDDSSMEDIVINNDSHSYELKQSKFLNKPHVFSLSLPRDNQLTLYASDKYPESHHGLQKLKRSVSGVFGNLGSRKELSQPKLSENQSDNWFLSKSAPNSLNNGLNSLEVKNSQKSDETEQLLTPPSNQNSGRVMYLPEYDNEQNHYHVRSKTKSDRMRSKSAERSSSNCRLSVYSKSCENIASETKSSEPKNLQDPPKIDKGVEHVACNRKRKRFTFQSTVRQIERKKLAEKLSREAEKKEKQRLRELEAMQKVEEEFQKKRAREKANIRQQLRLYSMDDNSWSSLPPGLDIKEEISVNFKSRPEPDGAVSSSTSSPSLPLQSTPDSAKKNYQKSRKFSENMHKHRPSSESSEDTRIKTQGTQVLSEYKHPRREYKEYRASVRYESHTKQTTVHPQVTCNMPKAKGQNTNTKSGTNYRKDFAHGVKSSRSAGSTYSEDSQSRNNSPRMYHNKYAPMTRF